MRLVVAIAAALLLGGCFPAQEPRGPRQVRRETRAPEDEPAPPDEPPQDASNGGGESDKDKDKKKKRPGFAVVAAVRGTYPLWVQSPELAGAPMEDVFVSGPAFEIDAGLGMSRVFAIYLGWQHVLLAVGERSPYADLATVGAWEDRLVLGVMGTVVRYRWIGAWLDASGGFSNLHQQGEDASGDEATIDLPSYVLRLSGGAALDPIRWLSFRPSVGVAFAQVRSASTEGAGTKRSGHVARPGPRITFEPGLTVVGDWEVP